MKRRARLLLIVATLLVLAVGGIAGMTARQAPANPGFSTPRAALETFFASAERQEYQTTYACYDQAYHAKITESEFMSHRRQAAVLTAYSIDSLATDGTSARASVSLTFAGVSGGAPKHALVNEQLVNEAGSWRIRVW